VVQNPEAYALDFVFVAVFTALLMTLWRGKQDLRRGLSRSLIRSLSSDAAGETVYRDRRNQRRTGSGLLSFKLGIRMQEKRHHDGHGFQLHCFSRLVLPRSDLSAAFWWLDARR